MGIPYSKQINQAFDQVTPLVASGFEILQFIKEVTTLVAWIQVVMTVLLTLILLSMLGLIYSLNPDLEKERKALVTPVMKWMASWLTTSAGYRRFVLGLFIGMLVLSGFGFLAYVYYARQAVEDLIESEDKARSERGEGELEGPATEEEAKK